MTDRGEARPNDLRVVKTIDTIHSTFGQMLLQMDYRKITVKELCERARINKKTFYRYYETLDFLLLEIQRGYSDEYRALTAGMQLPGDTMAITRAFFEYGAGQGELYDRITCGGDLAAIRQGMIERVMEDRAYPGELPPGWDPESWRMFYEFMSQTNIGLYCQWVEGGRQVPLERMVAIAQTIVARALDAFGPTGPQVGV